MSETTIGQPVRAPMSNRKLATLIAGAGIVCAALGVGGGYVGASLNPAHDGARGAQGLPAPTARTARTAPTRTSAPSACA
jgi:hypothetical protein